jgi:hypothetical protein
MTTKQEIIDYIKEDFYITEYNMFTSKHEIENKEECDKLIQMIKDLKPEIKVNKCEHEFKPFSDTKEWICKKCDALTKDREIIIESGPITLTIPEIKNLAIKVKKLVWDEPWAFPDDIKSNVDGVYIWMDNPNKYTVNVLSWARVNVKSFEEAKALVQEKWDEYVLSLVEVE